MAAIRVSRKSLHDGVIKWKHLKRYWPFVLGTGEFPAQRPVTRSFDVFFDLRLNKRLSKQSWGWWFGTLSRPLWRHCNDFPLWGFFIDYTFTTVWSRIMSWWWPISSPVANHSFQTASAFESISIRHRSDAKVSDRCLIDVGPTVLAIWEVHNCSSRVLLLGPLVITHWGRDEISAILQTTFSNAFSWITRFEFRLIFHWNLFLMVQLTITRDWFR